jgi:hypothetical protein
MPTCPCVSGAVAREACFRQVICRDLGQARRPLEGGTAGATRLRQKYPPPEKGEVSSAWSWLESRS